MSSMTKLVNINAQVAIRTVTPPIYGTCKNVIMTTGDILKCICKRAIVEEILPDGSTIRLNMRNYYTDNGAGLDAKNRVKKEEEKKIPENFVTGMTIKPVDERAPEAPSKEAQVVETTMTEIEDNESLTNKLDDLELASHYESISSSNPITDTITAGPGNIPGETAATSADSAEIDNSADVVSVLPLPEEATVSISDETNNTTKTKTTSSKKNSKKKSNSNN